MMAIFPAPIKSLMYLKDKMNAVWMEWFRAVERALPSGDVVDTSSAQTLTNKVINADNNTLSNLDHGAEVDNPSSGVHGVTGSVVGTTDSQTLSAKTLTSPVLNTGLSGTAFLDEDNMASDSATKAASQQSVKAYIDSGTVTMTNKTLTSPVLNTQVTGTAVLDEDNMASNSATKVATQQSIKAYVDASSSSALQSNAIINGDFNIWQAGTSFAAIANGAYAADMFQAGYGGVMVATVSRDTDVPTQAQSNHQSAYSLKVDCTTIDASIDAADAFTLFKKIEGYNFRPFVGKQATLSFWVKSVKTGTYCVSFGNAGRNMSYVAEYTISSASTWEKKTVTVTFDYAGGTWDYANGAGLWIGWALATGTDYQGVADTWNAANDLGTSNQVNFFDNTANDFWLAQVQFELGSAATVFEYRQFGDELQKCQRYYEKSYSYSIAPASNSNVGTQKFTSRVADQLDYVTYGFSTAKRTTPTVTLYNWNTGATGQVRNDVSGAALNAATYAVGDKSFSIYPTATTTANNHYGFHWVAAARL